MRVTVCESNDASDAFTREWEQLVAHVKAESSQRVLLPEIPCCPWFAVTDQFDPAVWHKSVLAHDHWLERLKEPGPPDRDMSLLDGAISFDLNATILLDSTRKSHSGVRA